MCCRHVALHGCSVNKPDEFFYPFFFFFTELRKPVATKFERVWWYMSNWSDWLVWHDGNVMETVLQVRIHEAQSVISKSSSQTQGGHPADEIIIKKKRKKKLEMSGCLSTPDLTQSTLRAHLHWQPLECATVPARPHESHVFFKALINYSENVQHSCCSTLSA